MAAIGVPVPIPLTTAPGGEIKVGATNGTAFFVSDDYLLTAAHVIRATPNPVLYITFFARPGGKILSEIVPVPFETVEIDDDFDVALLHMLRKPNTGRTDVPRIRPFRIAVGSLPPGEGIAATGYGIGANLPLTLTAHTASHGSMEFELALQLLLMPRVRNESSVFVIDRPLPGGMSGSPVYLRDSGVVYGIAVSTKYDPKTQGPAISLAHPLERARELLDKHGVKYKITAPLSPLERP